METQRLLRILSIAAMAVIIPLTAVSLWIPRQLLVGSITVNLIQAII